MPRSAGFAERQRFMALADRLREQQRGTGIPVIVIGGPNGATSAVLQNELGTRILSKPEL
jgi:23S rRNA pseudoU1915 N3-methylase RlmH